MKTTYNDRQGNRDRQALCLVIPVSGEVFVFTGAAIPGVCAAAVVDRVKEGKWSSTTWEISHAETTAVVSWRQDWDLGVFFPQVSWEAGYFWLAGQAPALTRSAFEAFIRGEFSGAAVAWDAAAAAEVEYGFAATAAEVAAIQVAKERIAAEKAAYEADQADKRARSPFAVLAGLPSLANKGRSPW